MIFHYYRPRKCAIKMVLPNHIRGKWQRRYKKLYNEAEDCDCPKEVEAFLHQQSTNQSTNNNKIIVVSH